MEWMKKLLAKEMGLLMVVVNFSPTQDMVQVVLDQWVEVFADRIGRIDERLDTPRIEKAFKIAKGTFSTWPAPSQIIELMPRRPEVERIEYVPASNGYGKGYMDVCFKMIDGEITEEEANAKWAELDIKYGKDDKEIPF